MSDGCAAGERDDRSGALLEEWVSARGHSLTARSVVPDDRLTITRTLLSWADGGEVDVILTTGGTGFGPRDVTPEATLPVLDRQAGGLAERIRRRGESSTPFASLSRGLVGVRGAVLVANLPGSPGGVEDGLEVLGGMLTHAVALLRGGAPSHEPPEGQIA